MISPMCAIAVSGPMPGMVCTRGHMGCVRSIAWSFSVSYAIRFSKASTSSERCRNISALTGSAWPAYPRAHGRPTYGMCLCRGGAPSHTYAGADASHAPTRCGPRHCFADGFGLMGIVLWRLHRGIDERWRHQPHGMDMIADTPRPVVRPSTHVHAHADRRQCRDQVQPLTMGRMLSEHHRMSVIHPDDVTQQCNAVEAEDAPLLCQKTRLHIANGCSRCRNHAGV